MPCENLYCPRFRLVLTEVPSQPGLGARPVYLFLDIDGVLHPEGVGPELELCHLRNMETLLREFPQVLVVVSSAWRLESSFEELRQRFSPDMRPRDSVTLSRCWHWPICA